MVRLGEVMPTQAQEFLSKAVDASETVADELASAFRVEVDSSDVSEVAGMLARKMRREAFTAANGAKFERELDEKYGVMKDVVLHPTVQVRCVVCVGFLLACGSWLRWKRAACCTGSLRLLVWCVVSTCMVCSDTCPCMIPGARYPNMRLWGTA